MRALYLMPMVGDGLSKETARRPKYAREIERADPLHSWGMQETGDGRTLLKLDSTAAVHRALRRHADVEVVSHFDRDTRRAIAFGHEMRAETDFREAPIYIGGEAI